MKTPSVFIKKKEDETTDNIILSKKEVLESIPKTAIDKSDKELASKYAEYRWRILKLPNKTNETLEISIKKPNCDRLFRSHNSAWITYDKDNLLDQYVIKEYYWYPSLD